MVSAELVHKILGGYKLEFPRKRVQLNPLNPPPPLNLPLGIHMYIYYACEEDYVA